MIGKAMAEKRTCIICKKRIVGDQFINLTKQAYRHLDCEPGSKKWMQSEIGRNAKYRNLFKGGENCVFED